jgi:hypothetical protein
MATEAPLSISGAHRAALGQPNGPRGLPPPRPSPAVARRARPRAWKPRARTSAVRPPLCMEAQPFTWSDPPPSATPAVAKPSSFGGFFPDAAAAKDLAAKLEKLAGPQAGASCEGDAYAPLTPTFSVPLTTAGSTSPLSPLSTPTTPVAAIVLMGQAQAPKQQQQHHHHHHQHQHHQQQQHHLQQQFSQQQVHPAAAAPVPVGDSSCPLDDAAGFAAGFEAGYTDVEEDNAALRRQPDYGNPLEADGFAEAFQLGALPAPASTARRLMRPSSEFVACAGNPLDDAEAFATGFQLGYASGGEEDTFTLRRQPDCNPLEADGFAAGFQLGAAGVPKMRPCSSAGFAPVADNPLDDAEAFAAGFQLGYASH